MPSRLPAQSTQERGNGEHRDGPLAGADARPQRRQRDQSDRPAHPWTVAEPGSWAELAESTAFVFRGGGLALHPAHVALCAVAAVSASWVLPIGLGELLPWVGQSAWGPTLWAWFRLAWLVAVACVCGVIAARVMAARPSRAEVWGVMWPEVASAALCVSTYVSTLVGAMLAAWLFVAVGDWMGNALGATLAAMIGMVALLAVVVATLLLLLAVPAAAANDADAPDAIQRAAAHLIARPGLSLLLIAVSVGLAAGLGWLANLALTLVYATMSGPWETRPVLVWLPHTLVLFVVLAIGWAALTQALLTLREVVDREDRSSCWDPRPQAAAIHAAIEARSEAARETFEAREKRGDDRDAAAEAS